jgi:hypothetical protein
MITDIDTAAVLFYFYCSEGTLHDTTAQVLNTDVA